LVIESTQLQNGESNVERIDTKMARMRQLFLRYKSSENPVDFLLVIDTHSDYMSGGLVHGSGADGTPWYAPVTEVKKQGALLLFYF
jgi:hypothetical protein